MRVLIYNQILGLCLLFHVGLSGQSTPEEYGKYIYDMVVASNGQLPSEFVALAEYNAYIDELNKLPEHLREEIKYDATRSYGQVLHIFERECARITKLYAKNQADGAVFTFDEASYVPSKNFPNIGFITCIYRVALPDDEEEDGPLTDAFRFECIKTSSGWRILDGFFDPEP